MRRYSSLMLDIAKSKPLENFRSFNSLRTKNEPGSRPAGIGTVLKLRCPVKDMFDGFDSREMCAQMSIHNSLL